MQPESYAPAQPRRTTDVTRSVWRLGRLLAPSVKWPVTILETLLGTLLVVGFCYWLRPADPLLTGAGFPWIWLVPLVFALRYGSLSGLFSGMLLLGVWFMVMAPAPAPAPGGVFPTLFFVGGFLLTIVAGYFSDIWSTRIKHMQGVNDYVSDRLSVLTSNHYLLRVSHERLEQELLAQPFTLRDAVGFLQRQSAVQGMDEALPNMSSVLEFVALNCQLETASVYAVTGGQLSAQAVASIGNGCRLNPDDPMLRETLEHRMLVHLQELDSRESEYLACVPMKNSRDELRGVLLIQRMPFLAVSKDNLQLLMTLLGYYINGLESAHLIGRVQQHVPGCPAPVALELARLAQLQFETGVRSSLLVMAFPASGVADSLHDEMVRQQRVMDMLWTFSTERARIAVMLLPLAGNKGVDGYLMRLDDILMRQFNTGLAGAGVAVHAAHIDNNQPGEALAGLLRRCENHG